MERVLGVIVRGLVLESLEGLAMTRRGQAGLVGWLCRFCMGVDLPRACFSALLRSYLRLFGVDVFHCEGNEKNSGCGG